MTTKTVSLRLKLKTIEEMDKLLELAQARSRSEFIINAIKFCLDNDVCWQQFDPKSLQQGLP
ncbi:MAG: hypothetical protein QXF40_04310 [Metallosphaera sp.]